MILIVRATVDDKKNIIDCNNRNLPISYGDYDYDEYISGINYATFVAKDNDKLCGYIIGCCEKKKRIHIISFAVDEEYRRKGLGSRLMDSIENVATDICSTIRFTTLNVDIDNIDGIKFYSKYGFKKVVKILDYYGPGKDGLTLGKTIGS